MPAGPSVQGFWHSVGIIPYDFQTCKQRNFQLPYSPKIKQLNKLAVHRRFNAYYSDRVQSSTPNLWNRT